VSDHLQDELGFNCGNLRLDTARNIQSRSLPFGKLEVGVEKLRREGCNKEIARMSAKTDDNGRADFSTAQVRKRNGQKNQVTARAVH